jgi:protein arginine kinase
MMEELFQNHALSWLDDSGNDNDVVLSSCVRLARNFRRIPFPNRADFKQLADVQKIAGNVLSDIEDALDEPFERIAIDKLTPLQQNVLVEKQLITRNLMKKPQYRSVFISNDRRCSIMVNEEDHLRVQCMSSGLDLDVPFTMASRVDDLVESKLDIAFDERMGYLTSCPTNLGTGLRASVLLHLPGLVFTNNINSIINISPQLGLAVRGIYSNGQETIGGIYQISNQLTLGFTEEEIIANLKSAVAEIIARERRARKALQMYTEDRLEDTVWRSYGILKCARFLASGEVIDLLSKVRLGVDLGIIDKMTSKQIAEILVASRSNFLQNIAGNENMSNNELDKRRAAMVRKLLGENSNAE